MTRAGVFGLDLMEHPRDWRRAHKDLVKPPRPLHEAAQELFGLHKGQADIWQRHRDSILVTRKALEDALTEEETKAQAARKVAADAKQEEVIEQSARYRHLLASAVKADQKAKAKARSEQKKRLARKRPKNTRQNKKARVVAAVAREASQPLIDSFLTGGRI